MEDWESLARTIGFENEKAMLTFFYLKEELPLKEIASKLGFGPATILNRLAKHDIVRRARGGANNSQRISRKLTRMDQRVVFTLTDEVLSHLLRCHRSTVYKYKRGVMGGRKPWSSVS